MSLYNLRIWRSQYCLLKNVLRTFAVMAENFENCQLPTTEATIDATAVNLVTDDDSDFTKQEPEDIQLKPEDEPKRKKKKRKLQNKNVSEKSQKPNYFVGIKICNKEEWRPAEKIWHETIL